MSVSELPSRSAENPSGLGALSTAYGGTTEHVDTSYPVIPKLGRYGAEVYMQIPLEDVNNPISIAELLQQHGCTRNDSLVIQTIDSQGRVVGLLAYHGRDYLDPAPSET